MYYEIVKSLCEQKGFTIQEVEKQAGLANGTIGKWRMFNPSLANIKKIANFFDISLEEFITRSDEPIK